MLRHEGWCCRWRLRTGVTDGENQFAFHGRLPCSDLSPQHHQCLARQLSVPAPQGRVFAARDILETCTRCERPCPAQCGDRSAWRWCGVRDGIRHYPCIRIDGHPLPCYQRGRLATPYREHRAGHYSRWKTLQSEGLGCCWSYHGSVA